MKSHPRKDRFPPVIPPKGRLLLLAAGILFFSGNALAGVTLAFRGGNEE